MGIAGQRAPRCRPKWGFYPQSAPLARRIGSITFWPLQSCRPCHERPLLAVAKRVVCVLVLVWSAVTSLAQDSVIFALLADPTGGERARIESVHDLATLAPAHQHQEHAIDLEARVTFVDIPWKLLWIEGDGVTSYLQLNDNVPGLASDQRIRITGLLTPAEGLRSDRVRIRVLEPFDPVTSISIQSGFFESVRYDQRVVTVEGYVQSQQVVDAEHLRLTLIIEGQLVACVVPPGRLDRRPDWRGKFVRVRALYALAPDPHGSGVHPQLWAPQPSDVQELPALGRTIPRAGVDVESQTGSLTINDPSQVWSLSSEEKNLNYPLRIEGRVNHIDREWRLLWLQTDAAPGFIELSSSAPDMAAGQRVLIEGSIVPARGLSADKVKVTVLEEHQPIQPMDTRGRISEITVFDRQVVLVEGYVDSERIVDAQHLRLGLIVENRHVVCWVPSARWENLPNWRGSFVQVQALYSGRSDPTGTETIVELWLNRPEDLVVTGRLAEDPRFRLPLTAISEVHRAGLGDLVRLSGRILRREAGVSLVLRDDTGSMEVFSAQEERLPANAAVEVVGRVALKGARWVVQDALFRRLQLTPVSVDGLAADPDRPLRSVQQVRELSLEEAHHRRRVLLTGVVTWSMPGANFFYLQDGSGGTRVEIDPKRFGTPAINKRMAVLGHTFARGFAPAVRAEHLDDLGVLGAPQAKPIEFQQALAGSEEGQWVELRGFLRANEIEENVRLIRLTTPSGEFTAHTQANDGYHAAPGSLIRVRGVCESQTDDNGRITGVMLRVPFLQDVTVEEDAPEDLFQIPLRPVRGLRQLSTVQDIARVRVAATVLHHMAGEHLFVQDGDAGLMILSRSRETFAPGTRIEAVGILGWQGARTVLRDATLRKIEAGPAPTPVRLEDPERFSTFFDSRLVQLAGTVLDIGGRADSTRLTLQTGSTLYEAILPGAEDALASMGVTVGAEIDATGIYRVGFDDSRETRGFELLLRSPADVQLLKPARLWTLQRALIACAVLAVLILLGMAWVTGLRRRVRLQTEQIRAQLEKEGALEARHRSIVESASDCILTTDLQGRITSMNAAGERLTGYNREEAQGLTLADLLWPAQDDEPMPAFLPQDDGTVTFQSRLRTHSGELVWIETSTRLIGEPGRIAGVLAIVRDISERKQVEQELKRACDAAEANTRAKSEFLANMSHEIRTPMNAVIGMANLLLDTPLNDQQRDFADTIRNGAEALLTVLNDILDFSKMEAGRLQFETLNFDLRDVVETTADLLSARAAAKRLELTAFTPTNVPCELRGDPSRLRQVLLNLLGNAIKFTEVGDVALSVSVVEEMGERVRLRFEVADTGIGMTPEQLARLFRPFSQADTSTTRRFGGTGLGLAIAKQIVELMEGECGVSSAPGRGSTFWFTAIFARQLPAPVSHAPAGVSPALTGLRVLIVDDSARHRELLQHYLTAWKVPTQTAETARDALLTLEHAITQGAPFNLVLLDEQLTEGGGLILARRIRQDSRFAECGILLLTALDRSLVATEMEALHIAGSVMKPIRLADLQHALERAHAAIGRTARSHFHEPKANGTAPSADRRPNGPALRVLVAEDNVVNQRVAALQLRNLGHTVDVASNGLEVLEALERARFDVILMDCQMPEMDGYEATRRLRQHPVHGRVQVIALTANAMQGDREKCLEAGMNDYLSKPMRLPDLAAALARLAARQNAEEPTPFTAAA